MNAVLYAAILTLLWVVNLFNGTGLGAVYQTTEYAKTVILILSIVVFLIKYKQQQGMLVKRKDIYAFGAVIIYFIVTSYFNGYLQSCLKYIWAYLIIFLVGQMKVTSKGMKLTSLSYGLLGLAILLIYVYGSTLSGWNSNSIAMIGFYSYMVCCIPFFLQKNIGSKILLLLVSVIYMYLLVQTDSRSCIIFGIMFALFAFNILNEKLFLKSDKRILVWLLTPIIVALIIPSVSGTELAMELNIWSQEVFNKPIFNGRDGMWMEGLKMFVEHCVIGTSNLAAGYYHNASLVCLVSYGIVGFGLWVNSLRVVLCKGLSWIQDSIVSGGLIGFLVLYLQQSVEQGLVAENPNIIPYILLGILLGRIKSLKEHSNVTN